MVAVQKLVTQIIFIWLNEILFISNLKALSHFICDLVDKDLLVANKEKLTVEETSMLNFLIQKMPNFKTFLDLVSVGDY